MGPIPRSCKKCKTLIGNLSDENYEKLKFICHVCGLEQVFNSGFSTGLDNGWMYDALITRLDNSSGMLGDLEKLIDWKTVKENAKLYTPHIVKYLPEVIEGMSAGDMLLIDSGSLIEKEFCYCMNEESEKRIEKNTGKKRLLLLLEYEDELE